MHISYRHAALPQHTERGTLNTFSLYSKRHGLCLVKRVTNFYYYEIVANAKFLQALQMLKYDSSGSSLPLQYSICKTQNVWGKLLYMTMKKNNADLDTR